MIGEMGSAKYYHNIIGEESFEKMNVTKKGNILGKVWYRILKNKTRTNIIFISSISNIYRANFESDKNDWIKKKSKTLLYYDR